MQLVISKHFLLTCAVVEGHVVEDLAAFDWIGKGLDWEILGRSWKIYASDQHHMQRD